MKPTPRLLDRHLADYCAQRGRSSIAFERAVLERAFATHDAHRVLGRSTPPLRMRVLGLVSERARADLVYWHRLRDYVSWRVWSQL